MSGVGSHGSIEHELRIQHLLARARRVNEPGAGVYKELALYLSFTLSFYPAIIWTSNMYMTSNINWSQPHENTLHCLTPGQEHVSLICSLCTLNQCLRPLTDSDHLGVHLMNETSTSTHGSWICSLNRTQGVLHHVLAPPTVKSLWSKLPFHIKYILIGCDCVAFSHTIWTD